MSGRIRVLPVLVNLVTVRCRERAGQARGDRLQRRALVRLVRQAAAAVPHYRRAIGPARAAAFSGPADLAGLPVLDRRALSGPATGGLLADGFTPDTTKPATTSGSSGVPVTVHNSERDLAYLRAVHLDDMLAAGLRPWDRVAYFRVMPFLRHPLERLGLVATVHVDTSAPLDRQVDAFLAGRPTFVVGFPSVVLGVVEELERRGVRYRGVRNVLFGGERLSPAARARIVDHFGARASEVYATVETFTIARSCREGRLHVRRGDVVVEVERDDGTVALEHGEGDVLVTRLRSEAMPLIRYRVGDRVAIAATSCGCGAPGPVVDAVHGRSEDRLTAPDGRLLHGDFVTAAVQGFAAVTQLQITQHRPGQLAVAVTTVADPPPGLVDELRASVAGALPGWDTDVAVVDAIVPEANGKVRLVKVVHDVRSGPGSVAGPRRRGPDPVVAPSRRTPDPNDDADPASRPRTAP
jgi:phenylacetate-CoA ligase